MTGLPTGLPPLKIVKVTIPSLIVPAVLLTWALRLIDWFVVALKVAEALVVVVTVAAGLTVRKCWMSIAGR